MRTVVSVTDSSVKGRSFRYTLISRRSCHRAGTRYNIRGIDTDGQTANFVETEQIVEFGNSRCSYVQVCASVNGLFHSLSCFYYLQYNDCHHQVSNVWILFIYCIYITILKPVLLGNFFLKILFERPVTWLFCNIEHFLFCVIYFWYYFWKNHTACLLKENFKIKISSVIRSYWEDTFLYHFCLHMLPKFLFRRSDMDWSKNLQQRHIVESSWLFWFPAVNSCKFLCYMLYSSVFLRHICCFCLVF